MQYERVLLQLLPKVAREQVGEHCGPFQIKYSDSFILIAIGC